MTLRIHTLRSASSQPANYKATTVAETWGFNGQSKRVAQEFRSDGIAVHVPEDATARLRTCVKQLVVLAACWGFPAAWAQWLIVRGGLVHA